MPETEGDQLRARVEELALQLTEIRERILLLEGRVREGDEPVPVSVPDQTSQNDRARFGLTAVNRIGAFTLAVGIIFFFKYAVDNEWIGAAGRVLAGLIAGVLLIAAAEWLSRRDQGTFAQGVAGCGIATLYISVYAAFSYYKLLSQTAGYVSLVAISSVAVALALHYSNQAIAALGYLGGVLTPMLLHAAAPAFWPDAMYLALLDFSTILIAGQRRWLPLIPGIAAATLFAGWFVFNARDPGRFALFAFALAALQFAGVARFSIPPLRTVLYLTGSGCLTIAVLRELEIWTSHNISLANRPSITSQTDSIFLALYGVAALSYGIARASRVNRSLGLFLLGLVITKLYLWDIWFLERFYRTTAFVSLGVLLLSASWIYSRAKL